MFRAMMLYAHPIRLLRAQPELRELALWAAPPFALLSSFAVLQSAELWLGQRWGFALGLAFYWIVWCALVPYAVLGSDGFRRIFARSERALRLRDALLLMTPPVVAFSTVFPLMVWVGNGRLFVVAAIVALLNGTFEEVLWRGAYLQVFDNRLWGGLLYPAIGFGLWHLAPLVAHWSWSPARGPLLALGATVVGLAYTIVARRTRSIRWTILSHVLMNFAGLGALAYFA